MIDDSRFPLVILTCPSEITPAFLSEFERGFERIFARQSKYIVVCDLRQISKVPDALTRKRLSEILNRPDFKAKQDRLQVGSANIIESAGIRAALTALLWVWHPAAPMSTPRSSGEAIEWALARLREAGVPISATLEAFALTGAGDTAKRAAR